MIPHIIHFSVPKEVSAAQAGCIDRASSLHPDWEVRVWRDPVSQDGFRLAKYWPLANSGAQLADLLRLEIVSRFGGVYLDSDVMLVKRLDEIADSCEFFIASENGVGATNAVFGATAGHPVFAEMIGELLARPPDWSLPPSITTGPVLFARFLRWRRDFTPLPRESFYPYAYNEPAKASRPGTYGVHMWAKSWTRPPKFHQALDRLSALWKWSRLARAILRRGRRWYHSNEQALRWLGKKVESYGRSESIVRRTVHGHRIVLSGSDLSITPEVVRSGFYELREELFVRRTLAGGDFFVDVGANVGIFTLLAASLIGPFGRAYAYEPNPAASELLKQSAAMNWMHDRIVLRQVAVGSGGGQALIDFSRTCLGGAAVRRESEDSGTSAQTAAFLGQITTLNVNVVALDSEFPYDIPIKLLKIDVEGHEADVLRGARRLLANQCIEYVMLEAVQEVSGTAWGNLLETLEETLKVGYQLYTLASHGELKPVSLHGVACGETAHATRNIVLKSVR